MFPETNNTYINKKKRKQVLFEWTQSSAGVTQSCHSPTLAGTHIPPLNKLSGKTN